MYDKAEAATIEFERMLAAARRAGHLIETDDEDELGDPRTGGPVTTDIGAENLSDT